MTLGDLLSPGDAIIDGGNSWFKDDVRRAQGAGAERASHYVDAGTSGGVWGAERGYCLMVGGPTEAVARLEPIFATLAPGESGIPPSRGRDGKASTAQLGYLHCGPSGAGHFVKMIHNGIEYGLMQAYAEGFDILRHAGDETRPADHRYDFDLADIAELWRRGQRRRRRGCWTSRRSRWPKTRASRSYTGFVQDSGEGRWTLLAAIEEAVPGRRAVGLALRAVPVAPGPHVRREAAVGDAEAVRRARRAEVTVTSPRNRHTSFPHYNSRIVASRPLPRASIGRWPTTRRCSSSAL